MSTDETLRNESPFVRVGTTLYKIVNQPRLNGGYVKKRIVWNNETLRQDYGKDYLANVPKYDGFCTVPDHVNYRQVIDNFLNLYEPIGHQPKEGDFSHIQALLHHIFGEQYEIGGRLFATPLFASYSEIADFIIGIGRTQYGKEYVPESYVPQ